MQIEKALIKDRLNISKVSWKCRIPTIYSFAVIYPWNLQLLWKLPPLQNNNFSKCAIWGTGYEFFYFVEKLYSILKILKFFYI